MKYSQLHFIFYGTRMKIQYIRIGIIILILIGLGFYFYTTEGFLVGSSGSISNVTGKSNIIVVNSSLKNLTNAGTLTALASIETGNNNAAYAVIGISDYTGKMLWSTGMAQSTITTPNQYQLTFKTPITTTRFQERLPNASINVSWVGLEFTSPFVIVQKEASKWPSNDLSGTLWNLTDKYYLGIFKTIGDGVSAIKVRKDDGTYSYPFDVASIDDTNGKSVWTKSYTRDTSGNTNIMGDKNTNMYSVNFSQPVSLSLAKKIIQSKTIFNYVGLNSTDTPDTPVDITKGSSYYNSNTYKPTVTPGISDISNKLVPDQASSFNPSSTALTGGDAAPTTRSNPTTGGTPSAPRSEGGYGSTSYTSPTYQDPAAQPMATPTNLSGIGPSTATMKTNRIKVRALYKTIVLPSIIQSLQKGSNTTVTEILNETSAPVWPETNPPYTDSGIPEVFTVGFNQTIDVPNTIQPYIQFFMPSITYLNPAMPRT